MRAECAICGDPIMHTIARPQYGPTPSAPWPRGVGQRPWVHTNYLKTYDHEPAPIDSSEESDA